ARCEAEPRAQKIGEHIVPHRLRLAHERVAFRAQRLEAHAAQLLERSVVAVGELQLLRDLALPLEAFATHRSELATHQLGARGVHRVALTHVGGVRELDGYSLILYLAAVGETHDGA